MTGYGPLFIDALGAAAEWHLGQVRKGSQTPYLTHLMQAAGFVFEDGGSEVEATAALLHDTLEDTDATEDGLRQRFGAEVTRIVVACTDSYKPAGSVPAGNRSKEAWKQRKIAHIAHLAAADPSVARVAAADKLSNLLASLEDFAVHGPALWDRFKGGMAGTVWYQQQMFAVLAPKLTGAVLRRRLEPAVSELTSLGAREHQRLAGRDDEIAARLAGVPAAPGIGWHPEHAANLALEIARRLDGGPMDRDVVWRVIAGWYHQPLPGEPVARGQALEHLESSGPHRALADAVTSTVGSREP